MAKKTNTSLILSILGFASLFPPLGLLGAWLGYRHLRRARAAGERPTWQSRLAIALGLLSVANLIGILLWARHDQAARKAQMRSSLARVESARRDVKLTRETACALAEALLLERDVVATPVTCEGPLEADASSATLHGVTLQSTPPRTFSICLARRTRWFATASIQFGRCPEPLPDVPEAQSIEESERAVRKAMIDSAMRAELSALVDMLGRIRAALEKPGARNCPELGELTLPVFDTSVAPSETDPSPPDATWKFLTSSSIWNALDAQRSLRDRRNYALAAMELAQPFMLAIAPELRTAPQVGAKGFIPGHFAGRLALVDTAKAAVVCEAPLTFRSSESVKTGGGVNVGFKVLLKVNLGGKKLGDAVEKDFHENFQRATAKVLDQMVRGQVKIAR